MVAHVPRGALMLRATGRHVVLGLIIVIVLGLIVPPFINVGRYKLRIADSMSRALGRSVSFDKISLRLLPQPGFDFENFVVGDDPSFSAEPMLRADEVTAYLRMASLWRGQLEIARLQLSYPSLNLVRRGEGEWNLESLLYRASQTPVAPTTAKTPEARPRFPYIEATDGRINFKNGLEKKVFALTEAKFALWSPEQDRWRMRLEAKPVRTDIVIADSGLLRVEGSFERALFLRDTKLDLQASLERSQLGQLTRLIWGRDRGWRGAMRVQLHLNGSPANLHFQTDAVVDDFRRYDIIRGEAIRLQTHCTGKFSSVQQSIEDVACVIPAGRDGTLNLSGFLKGWQQRQFNVSLVSDKVPMSWIVALARHSKRDLPDDLTATGTLSAQLVLAKSAQEASAVLSGDGETSNFVLRSSLLNGTLALGRLQVTAGERVQPRQAKQQRQNPLRLEVLPFPVPLGASTPAVGSGWIAPDGYSLSLQGVGEISRILQLARTIGIGVPKFQLKGTAKLNTAISGTWKGFAQPAATGTMEVTNLTAEIPGLNAPLKISSADVQLAENSVTFRKLLATAQATAVSGTATFPRHCEDDLPCVAAINVQFDDLDLAHLNALLNPRLKKRPWYRLFGSTEEKSILANWHANGVITGRKFSAKPLTANNLTVNFSLADGRLTLDNLEASVFGGKQSGTWTLDFTGDQPIYTGSGTLSNAVVSQVAALTKDPWGTGQLSGSYVVKLSGTTQTDLLQSFTADCDFTWHNGQIRHLALDGRTGPVKFPAWSGHCQWTPEGLRITQSKLESGNSIYAVSGTIQPSRSLNLEFVRGDGTAYQVTGTLEKPEVSAPKAGRTAEASLRK
jgi:uncharacterized protein involved in outer membrane biogenesis